MRLFEFSFRNAPTNVSSYSENTLVASSQRIKTTQARKIMRLYVGCSESKERLCIQPAQLFHCTRSVIWCVQ